MSLNSEKKYKGKILIVDDERVALQNLTYIFKKENYNIVATSDSVEALELIKRKEFDVLLTDLKMEKIDGLELLKAMKYYQPEAETVIITAYATIDSAIEALKSGAFHYISKPFKLDEVRKIIAEAMEKVKLKKENKLLKQEIESLKGKVKIITHNQYMQDLLNTALQIAKTDCVVLITGESGTGKELFARFIHEASNRKDKPFIAINCGVFSEELLASELFGYEKGAFTGASQTKMGLVEQADGGTLFFDEIAEMSPSMQVKLLRLLQEHEFYRIGGLKPIKVNVRFIAATNRNLKKMVELGSFRQDLYYRLNVVHLHLPPLAERKEDIPVLAYYFLRRHAKAMNKNVKEIAPEVLHSLQQYDFPGNVRELENIIERGVALARGEVLDLTCLPEELKTLEIHTFRRKDGHYPTLEEHELAYIKWILKETKGNKTKAAKILGIDRVSLWRKLKKYGLDKDFIF
ncbi:two component, sigma54 specific, transcriptional regulator, Fis family [Thermodesulfatator indicus DSM 15286]|uniref:Two component, sigma54 specific, transcriptional regulator, Fis family n=1 Tax=Thermodesulfatator indicus (strain DSM 15286 / JCM 11887 / CIR29812) TaxID=667014 RepID=F8AA70_THEID|nr:sigma-54 dependent transcriptional regulator [Thermodesulfatator indicus]AEH44206.1 two component, sigma54 specific, transcriptional regulator, Fis family [Thermodesulfatator indicus DSM 15286]